MNPTVEAERAIRRARVVEALADAVGRALTDRGRRCRRVTLDAGSLLHPAGPGPPRAGHRAEPGDDLVLVNGCYLQHPEFLGAWELVVFLREGAVSPGPGSADRAADGSQDRACTGAQYLTQVDPEGTADIVVDLHDPAWPVIRRMDPVVAARLGPAVQLAETRAFFAPRATSWEQQFPDDDPAYAAAVAELGLRPGQTALDAGCGTGRALPHLRATVGQTGHVLGFDLTPEMLATARRHGRHAHALLVLADARRLPLPAGSVDGGFAAGLLPHLPDPGQGLAELARVIALGGRLVLFHPSGRAALAARHGRRLREDDLLAPDPLRHRLQRTGWWLARYDDGPDRFLAVAERVSPRP
ncbi:MAG: methyltransferase domain-containing protein [Acidimicrobiales bacterium]